ncbi:MAG: hypothetical protein K2L96_00380 [Muribaculaceae bacterium]|nr:hypothetical protein [Muribaculaceae bacterium]
MADNKLIMKNTGFMAVRMLFSMGVTLFTSRVVLQQLGVVDFGIYTVIGGLAILMSFFTSALTAAIQRYMNVELAMTQGREMQQVFAACWGCVFAMAALFLLIAEAGGLWFLNSELNIPPDRMHAARIVFQMSLAIVVIEMMRVPYNSLIIAHEKMSFYAYNSILEVCLKLVTAISLSMMPGSKIIIYMWLLIAVAVLINVSYIAFCHRILPSVHFSLKAEPSRIAAIGKFAGWNVLTSISDVAYQQGSGMILNIFFGVTFNASMGIANQVKSAVSSFTRSVQLAANPQLIKTFAAGAQEEFSRLFMRISRVSFYLMFFLGVPILVNAGYILSLWLTVIPPMGALFVRLMVVFCILDSLTGPLWVSMQAAGRLAAYQLVISIVWILALPITYLVFKAGEPPFWLLIVLIAINAALLSVRVGFTARYCGVSVASYCRGVLVPIGAVGLCSMLLIFPAVYIASPLMRLMVSCAAWCVVMPAAVYFLGLSHGEKAALKTFIAKRLKG